MLRVLCLPIAFLVALVWMVATLVSMVKAGRRRLWRRAVSLLGICVGVWPAFAFLIVVGGDYIHLTLAYSFYAARVTASYEASWPIAFRWGGMGFAGSGNLERTLVYDPTGKLSSESGSNKMPDYGPDGSRSINHLVGHFYLVEISW